MSAELVVHFGERQRAGRRLVADALLDRFAEAGLAHSVLLRGVEGYGAGRRLRTDATLTLSEDLPAVALARDELHRLRPVAAVAAELVPSGVVLLAPAVPAIPGGTARLTVHLGRRDRMAQRPAHLALCDLFRELGLAGATVLLGVDGTRSGRRQRAGFFARNADVPLLVRAISDTADVERARAAVAGALPGAVVGVDGLDVLKRDGRLLRRPAGGPGWRRLVVHTSEAARHDGRPVHRALVRALRSAGAAGATTVRGIRGFHGDHPPHGDRVLQYGRRVPTVTSVIDTAERVAKWFGVVDELTAERGLVVIEDVPAPVPSPWERIARDDPSVG